MASFLLRSFGMTRTCDAWAIALGLSITACSSTVEAPKQPVTETHAIDNPDINIVANCATGTLSSLISQDDAGFIANAENGSPLYSSFTVVSYEQQESNPWQIFFPQVGVPLYPNSPPI